MSELKLTLTEDHYRQLVNSFSKWEIENLVNLFDQRGIYPKYTYNNYQTLTFDVPDTEIEPVSTWRTDIENAPRDESDILGVIAGYNHVLHYYHSELSETMGNFQVWHSDEWSYKDEDITHWMPIPEIPTI